MNLDLNAVVQLVILTFGVYFALGFLRSARGTGLVRGLVVATLFGAVFLWWISWVFAFEELEHIIRGLTGYTVIVLAIVFQPELRRGIAQIGVARLLGQYLNKNRPETVAEVAKAARSMAKRRQGALIAFERETPLDDYIQSGVQIDAAPSRLLIDTIFHPGSALHDGAIVVRKDRVTAALCLFPLTENVEIAKSTGTRHRAALGLTDETDAVAVAVSEETGDISLCREGKMVRGIPPKELEALLREALASEKEVAAANAAANDTPAAARPGTAERALGLVTGFFQRNLLRKVGAVAFAGVMFFLARQEITAETPVSLRVRSTTDPNETPRGGDLLVRLPSDDYSLVLPADGQRLQFVATGTRGLIENVGATLAGVLVIDTHTPATGVDLPLDLVEWSRTDGTRQGSVDVGFAQGRSRLLVQRVSRRPRVLTPTDLRIEQEGFDSRFVARIEDAKFDPPNVVVVGPKDRIEDLGSEALPFELEKLELGAGNTQDVYTNLGLSHRLLEAGFRFEHGNYVTLTVPVVPSLRDLSSIEREIAVVNLAPLGDATEVDGGTLPVTNLHWVLPPHAQVARFRIRTAGILPADDPSDPDGVDRQTLAAAVRRFVEENLVVFVDVSELQSRERRSARVRYILRRDWRQALAEEGIQLDQRADLTLELESEPEVLLVEAETRESDPSPTKD